MGFKFNWGHGLVVTMALFVLFIGSFVYKVMFIDKYDHHLISEKYYMDELHYQDEIDEQNNGFALKQNVITKQSNQGLSIIFPDNFDYKKIKASFKLQRLSDEDLDIVKESIELDSLHYLIPDKQLAPGFYNLKLDWSYGGKSYQYREKIEY